jgi:hypothetical protein
MTGRANFVFIGRIKESRYISNHSAVIIQNDSKSQRFHAT